MNHYHTLLITALALLAILLLVSCGGVPVKMDPDVVYRKDLKFCVEGLACYEGNAVVPYQQEYQLEISPAKEDQIDRIVYHSCNRNKGFEPMQEGGLSDLPFFGKFFGKKKKGHRYLYHPLPGIEDSGDCDLYFYILDMENEQHAWSMMRLQHPKYQLDAFLQCNGEQGNWKGVSICEGRVGTIQRIRFPQPVGGRVQPANCPLPYKIPTLSNTYEWSLAKGLCNYLFSTQNGVEHSMVSFGYEGLRLKQDKGQ